MPFVTIWAYCAAINLWISRVKRPRISRLTRYNGPPDEMKDLMIRFNKNSLSNRSLATFYLGVMVMVSLFFSKPLAAQGEVPLELLFTIRDIKVDETARSAAAARLTALAKAEEEAYEKLLAKLTQEEDRARLPELSLSERQALISGIELVSEQTSSRRYLATLNVRFEPTLVSNFFAEYQVPHILAAGRSILVLHAHKRGLENVFWVPDASVENARGNVDWVNRIRDYKFALGSLRERLALSAEQVQAFDHDAALKVTSINNLDSALVIATEKQFKADGAASLRYKFYATDSLTTGEGVVDLLSSSSNDEEIGLAQIYGKVLTQIDEAWRERLLVDTGEQATISVLVPTQTSAKWAEIKNKIDGISLVKSVVVDEISVPVSRITVAYTGKQSQLAFALQFAGLDLQPYGDDMMIDVIKGR